MGPHYHVTSLPGKAGFVILLFLKPSLSKAQIEKSLRSSIKDGAGWAATVGFAEAFFSPFAIFLGAGPVFLGVITTLPQLAGSLLQWGSSFFLKKLGSQKALVLLCVTVQALSLLAIAGGAVLRYSPPILLCLLIIYFSAFFVSQPTWQGWMGGLVPEQERGYFFGKRNRMIASITLLSLLGGGMILHYFEKERGSASLGFLVLFFLGVLGRLSSLAFLNQQSEGPWQECRDPHPSPSSSLVHLFRFLTSHPYGIFVLFISVFSFASSLAVPYFVPFVLLKLGWSYLEFAASLVVLFGFKFLTSPLWGRLSDAGDARRFLGLAVILYAISPFLWLFSNNTIYLISIQAIGGTALAGFELCSFRRILDGTNEENRIRYASLYQGLVGTGVVAGSLLGGQILKYLDNSLNAYLTLIALSGGLRLLTAMIFFPRVKEAGSKGNPLS